MGVNAPGYGNRYCDQTDTDITQESMKLKSLPGPVEDGIRVGSMVCLFLGLGLGLGSRLMGNAYLSDFLEFCSW